MSNSAIPWTAAHQAPPSMDVSRQEHWSGSPVPSPEIWQVVGNTGLELREIWAGEIVLLSITVCLKVKEESEKVDLKLNIQKTKIMASGPITSWQIDGKTMETVRDFIFLSSKITAYGNCSHGIQMLVPW